MVLGWKIENMACRCARNDIGNDWHLSIFCQEKTEKCLNTNLFAGEHFELYFFEKKKLRAEIIEELQIKNYFRIVYL